MKYSIKRYNNLKFLLDENVPISIKDIINDLGHKAITLRDENQLGIVNGEVAKLSLKKNYIRF
jgi:predicted nuclease of predicted toxin-antitoxin system